MLNKYKKYLVKINDLKNTNKNLKNMFIENIISNNKNDKLNKMNKYIKKHVSEPWFSLIGNGRKSVEGRLNKGDFKDLQIGDTILWYNNDIQNKEILTKVTKKTVYKTFKQYLKKEGIDNCLPDTNNIRDGINIYYKYYTKEQEKEFGVVAIRLELIS